MTSTWSIAVSSCLALGLLGCGLVINGEELGDEGGVDEDIVEYEQLVESLDAGREQALDDEVVEVTTGGAWLAWIEGSTLGLRQVPGELELALSAPSLGYRVSDSRVVARELGDAGVVYRGFELPGGELIDEQLMTDAQAPFALVDDVALIIEGGELWRWKVGSEAPVSLGLVGELGIGGEDLVALEALSPERALVQADDRLWLIELVDLAATELAELDELLAVGSRGALLHRGEGLYLHGLDGESVRIDAAIADSGWSLNPTFASIHEYSGDGATLIDDRVVYIGRAGVFAYTLDETGPAAIEPILIEPR